jgi:type IV secretory pathway TraG/TraD family ATPase VirD4
MIGKRKMAVFITTSPVNPAHNLIVNVFYSQMFKNFFDVRENEKSTKLRIPIRIICDDFACGTKIYNFHEYLSICREEGISVTILLQNESQLRTIYGEYEAQTILNNSDTYIYMGGIDIHTAEQVAKRANKTLEEILYMPVGKELIFRRGEAEPIETERYDTLNDEQYRSMEKLYIA